MLATTQGGLTAVVHAQGTGESLPRRPLWPEQQPAQTTLSSSIQTVLSAFRALAASAVMLLNARLGSFVQERVMHGVVMAARNVVCMGMLYGFAHAACCCVHADTRPTFDGLRRLNCKIPSM